MQRITTLGNQVQVDKGTVCVILRDPYYKHSCKIHDGTLKNDKNDSNFSDGKRTKKT